MDTSLCGQPGKVEASSLCWRSVYSFAINANLKINYDAVYPEVYILQAA